MITFTEFAFACRAWLLVQRPAIQGFSTPDWFLMPKAHALTIVPEKIAIAMREIPQDDWWINGNGCAKTLDNSIGFHTWKS